MAHFNGKKHGGSHTTIINETQTIIEKIISISIIDRIVPGLIRKKQGKSNSRSVKIQFDQNRRIKITICSKAMVQEIFIHYKNKTGKQTVRTIKKTLQNYLSKKGFNFICNEK